jgi:hypothetical protein
MAPIKFEEQLKDKLEQRRIKPSSEAWKQLNNKLDANEKKHSIKGFWWMGIAATLVGVLLALNFVFKPNKEITEPTLVDTENKTVIDSNPLQVQEPLKENKALALEPNENLSEEKQQASKQQNAKAPLKAILKDKQKLINPKNIEEAVADVNDESAQEETSKTIIKTKPEIISFEDQKVKDVVAQIQKLQQKNKAVSDEEIETLLAAAQNEINMKKLYNEATNTVDANALLQSVENDLEQSFRDKVFQAIKSGYETVKTAVAERNN